MEEEVTDPQPDLNTDKLDELMARLRAQQNIVLAVIAGIVSALVGASL